MSIQDLYNTTFDLYSYEQTSRTNIGGVNKSTVLKQAGIPCYETELNEDTFYQYGKTNVQADHRIFCDLLANIKSSDKIYCYGTGFWYDILFIDYCNMMEHHVEIYCKTIEAPEGYA